MKEEKNTAVFSARLPVRQLAEIAISLQWKGIAFGSKSELLRRIVEHYYKIMKETNPSEIDITEDQALKFLMLKGFKKEDFSISREEKERFMVNLPAQESDRSKEIEEFIDEIGEDGIPKHLKKED